MNLNAVMITMIVALLIPIYEVWKDNNIWQKMLAFSSISSKASIMILIVSVLRDDWMVGVVGIIIMSVGNASLMLLSQLIKRMNDVLE
jgi:multicomponent Na+:H+ antiporter subunit F